MDVLLTAVCCCLVPTPVNSHVRAHNLLQVSSISLNDWGGVSKNRMSILFGKVSGAFCLYQPIVTVGVIIGSILQPRLQQAYCRAKWRGHYLIASWVLATFSSLRTWINLQKLGEMHPFRQVDYPSSTFFNLTFASSLLVPLSALLYAIFKWDTMLSDVPRWRNRFADLIFKNFGQGDDILAEQSNHTSSQVSHPCHWDLGGRSSSADHLGKVQNRIWIDWHKFNLFFKEIFQFLRASCDTEWKFFTISLRLPTFVRPFLQSFSGGTYNMRLVLWSSRSGRDLAPLLSRASPRNYSTELFNPCLCFSQSRSSHSCSPNKLLNHICARRRYIWATRRQQGDAFLRPHGEESAFYDGRGGKSPS